MNIAIIDFDRTLFDTERHVKDLCEALCIDKLELYERLDELADHSDVQPFFRNIRQYMFKEWDEAIATLREKYDSVILLTKACHGYHWQHQKIAASNIKDFVDTVIITERSKKFDVEEIIERTGATEIVFINDRVNENAEIEEFLPQVKVIEIDNYSEHPTEGRLALSDI